MRIQTISREWRHSSIQSLARIIPKRATTKPNPSALTSANPSEKGSLSGKIDSWVFFLLWHRLVNNLYSESTTGLAPPLSSSVWFNAFRYASRSCCRACLPIGSGNSVG